MKLILIGYTYNNSEHNIQMDGTDFPMYRYGSHSRRLSIMANGTIAFDTLQTSGQITGTAKSVDTDYVVNGSANSLGQIDMELFYR